MIDACTVIGETLASGGRRADMLASVICALVVEGAELGALEEIEIRELGEIRIIKVPPRLWFDRLALAVLGGVFDHPHDKTLRKVVDRILTQPEAAKA